MQDGFRRIRGLSSVGPIRTIAICAAALSVLAASDAAFAGAIGDRPWAGPGDERRATSTLALDVGDNLLVGRRIPVVADGFADPGRAVWMFADPTGAPCAPSPAAQPPESAPLASAVAVSGAFLVPAWFRLKQLGSHTFCAYLGPSPEVADLVAAQERVVRRPRLRAAIAGRTVVIALRRHGFANRVVESLEQRCRRRGRTRFTCRFSVSFPGYELAGRGRVALGDRLSYRFRVEAQGREFVLTQSNEERTSP